MAGQKLPPNTTIKNVQHTLQKPEEYVRIVLSHLMDCKREKQAAPLVRIGVTGVGKVPYHKVIYKSDEGLEVLFGAYDGEHKFSGPIQDGDTWSTVAMTIADVRSALGEIRSLKGKATKDA